jgi:hypothetical protein
MRGVQPWEMVIVILGLAFIIAAAVVWFGVDLWGV